MCSSSGGEETLVLTSSDPKTLRQFLEAVLERCKTSGFSENDIFAIRLCYEEAVANALIHGNRRDPTKKVTVRCQFGPDWIRLRIEDEGEGFDPATVPDPTAPENLTRPSGRGLLLMRHYMEVTVHPPGNIVELLRRKSSSDLDRRH